MNMSEGDKTNCPLCEAEITLEKNDEGLAAYCSCRGERVPVIQVMVAQESDKPARKSHGKGE